jgi:hypothetical protein
MRSFKALDETTLKPEREKELRAALQRGKPGKLLD